MKTATMIGLVFCFYLALGSQAQAAEYFRYRDPDGRLVISNKPPPPGSWVLRKLELPETADAQVQQPQAGDDTQLNEQSESSEQLSKEK